MLSIKKIIYIYYFNIAESELITKEILRRNLWTGANVEHGPFTSRASKFSIENRIGSKKTGGTCNYISSIEFSNKLNGLVEKGVGINCIRLVNLKPISSTSKQIVY